MPPRKPRFPIFCANLIALFCFLLNAHISLSLRAFNNEEDEILSLNEDNESRNSREENGFGFAKIEKARIKFEIKRIHHAFENVDKLLAKAIVKVAKIDKQNNALNQHETSLQDFMTGPHDLQEILNILKEELKNIKEQAIKDLAELKPQSLVQAIQFLWKENYLSSKESKALLKKRALLLPKEAVRLVENGVVKTQSGYLVQLRTGDSFGDSLKLNSDMALAIRKLAKKKVIDSNTPDILAMLHSNLRKDVLEAFDELALDGQKTISDAHVLQEMRKYFLFFNTIGLMTWFSPDVVSGSATVDNKNIIDLIITPNHISATLIANHYLESINASTNHSFFVNPLGISYSGNFLLSQRGLDWWLYYSDGYLGGGLNYSINFDQNSLWSNSKISYLAFGLNVSGWKNSLSAGLSLQTLLSNSIGVGVSARVSMSRSHDVSYLGEVPLDAKIASIRGLHKIEIDDNESISTQAALSLNFSASSVPLAVAFRAGKENTKKRIYRTHTELEKSQSLLAESELSGLLFHYGKKIKESRVPTFQKPEILLDGDELIEIKSGKLSGAFVIGLESFVPIHASRLGAGIDMVAEFELGIKRHPGNKFEVSIEPKKVYEISLFGSLLNIFGAGHVRCFAIARKQIFIFDFNNPEARILYFDLVNQGRLPSTDEIEISTKDRGPEHLIAELRSQNNDIRKKGVETIYLEEVKINTKKTYVGFNAPIIPAVLSIANKIDEKTRKSKNRLNLAFEGIDREFLQSHAESVATNGIVAVSRSTFGKRSSEGQGTSGRYSQELYVTHRRIHTIEEKPFSFSENKWQFDSLIIHAQIADTKITGNEENKIVDKINKLFNAFIGDFQIKNSKSPRSINIEREIDRRHLVELLRPETHDRVGQASRVSGISEKTLWELLKSLKHKHPDRQALMIKDFVENTEDFSGFAALHQLLGARVEELYIHTESAYMTAALEAKSFIAEYASVDPKNKTAKVGFTSINSHANRKEVRNFYNSAKQHLRTLKQQLRFLHDDKYLIDKNSSLIKIYGEEKVKELVESGIREDKVSTKTALVSARKSLVDLMNLEEQGVYLSDRLKIYKFANKKSLNLLQKSEIILDKFEQQKIDPNMDKKYLRERLSKSWRYLDKIENRLEKYENDIVMQEMDSKYLDNKKIQLESLRNRFEAVVSIAHLNKEGLRRLQEKFSPKGNFLATLINKRRNNDFRINGAFSQALRNSSHKNKDKIEKKESEKTLQRFASVPHFPKIKIEKEEKLLRKSKRISEIDEKNF
jgi:hypothetical protein